MSYISDLDAPLLKLTPNDDFSLRKACEGLHVTGRIGSGKTSAAKALACAYLRAGFGGLVTVAKSSDIAMWRQYCEETGRSKSLVVFGEDEAFNFLSYEMSRHGTEGISAVVDCLMRVLEAVKKASGSERTKGEESFFEESKRLLLRYSILPLYAANGTLSVGDIVRFINSAPKQAKDVTDPEWQRTSFMYEVMHAAMRSPKVPLPPGVLKDNIEYWTLAHSDIPEKTRGNMVITITAALDRFRHGRLQRAFCGRTTLVPEHSFHGAIILLAMPTTTWNDDGIIGQSLFKFIWQRAVLNRNSLAEKHRKRPLFQFSDEAQETVTSYDSKFIGLARDSLTCPVYLTQSLPAYYTKMGGDTPREEALELLGKFGTHLFLTNSCAETNEYASRIIGKVTKRRGTFSEGTSRNVNIGMSAGSSENFGDSSNYGSNGNSGMQGSSHGHNRSFGHTRGASNNWGENRGRTSGECVNTGYAEGMEFQYEPGDFGRLLKTGGKPNGNIVTGVWYQSGHTFNSSGTNNLVARFQQR